MEAADDRRGLLLPGPEGPGFYFFLGVKNPAQTTAAPLHNPNFNPDERAIPLGMRILSHLLLDALNTQSALAAGTPGF